MIAVWNGGPKLELFEIRQNRNVYTLIRNVLRNGFATVLPNKYVLLSRTFTELNRAGIATLIDDEAVVKKLPVTWKSSNFSLAGPVIFVNDTGNTFSDLTDKQLQLLRDHFERLSIAS